MSFIVQRHHPKVSICGTRQKQNNKGLLLTAFRLHLTADLDRFQVITHATECLSLQICHHTRLSSTRFKHMVSFSQSVAPVLYKRSQAAAVQELSTGQGLTMEHYWHLCYSYIFLLTICQYLNARTVTVRNMANEPLLNVYIFQNKTKMLFSIFFYFPCGTENVPNHDPKTKVHIKLWILYAVAPLASIGHDFVRLKTQLYGSTQSQTTVTLKEIGHKGTKCFAYCCSSTRWQNKTVD